MTRVLPMIALCLLSACGGGRGEVCDNSVDDDGDGLADCRDQDCFAVCGEQCGNAVDDDGDGLVDCADEDCDTTCGGGGGVEDCSNDVDDDGDFVIDCADDDCDAVCDADADGWITTALGGPDCDDTDPNVHPDADEVPYNGVDEDCDPATSDSDVDGDGFAFDVDCDDDSAASYPGAPETCGDGVVNDCDATGEPPREVCFTTRSLSTADAVMLGVSADDLAGYAVAPAGDVNFDGFADLVIGSYGDGPEETGAAYLVLGPVTGPIDLSTAQIKWTGESEEDWAGFSVAPGGDLTGNGLPDILISARYDDTTADNAGAVYVARVDAAGTVELSEAAAKIRAEDRGDSAGFSLDGLGDINGDGQDDLIIGALLNSNSGSQAGAAYVLLGPTTGNVELSLADYRLYGESPRDAAGCAVGAAGDLNGDGARDLLIGACQSDHAGEDSGTAYQFSTHVLGDRLLAAADGAMTGESNHDQLGSAVAGGGDVNGDGLDDVLIGAPFNDAEGDDAGAAYLALGPATTGMNQPDARLVGEEIGDRAGTSLAVVGDVDGDGYDDVVVGAPGSDEAGTDAGAAYLLFGPLAGPIDLANADARLLGAAAFDNAGQSVAAAGDVNGDLFLDVLVGAPFHDGVDGLAPSGGAAYLLTFGL